MKKLLIIPFYFITALSFSQIGINTSSPNLSAALEISSTSKGLLPPRLSTTQRDLIVSPSAGLQIWCTDCGTSGEMQVFNGLQWINMTFSGTLPTAPITAPTATSANLQATITFSPFFSDSPLAGYTVTSSPGGFTAIGTTSPIIVTGLTNGTSYTFTVVATNAFGNSLPSTASNPVIPINQ